MSDENGMRENEVPPEENAIHPLNEREPANEGGMSEWSYSMWIDPDRQDKLEKLLSEMGIDYTCQRLVF